jgi:site-specific DNA recombinase
MKYAIYCRKSSETEDRQILSLESQVTELKKLSDNLDLDIVKIYQESKSAKAPDKRPLFQEIIDQIKLEEIEGVVCWDINRLSRNPVDSGLLQWLLQNEKIKEIVTPRKTYHKEDTGLLMSVELGSANQFILDLSKNVKRGLRTKAEKGWLPNGSKPGYMNDKYSEKGNKKIKPDPIRFPLIKEVWNLMLTGKYSALQVFNILNTKLCYKSTKKKRIGGKPMQRSQFYTLLSDPFYYGEFEFPVGSGEYYQGKHKTMITKEEFEKVQTIMGNKSATRPSSKTFAFTGLMKCDECGSAITAEEKKKYYRKTNNHAHYIYYHCTHRKTGNTCKQGSIEQKELEKQFLESLDKISIPHNFAQFAIDNLYRIQQEDQRLGKDIQKNTENQIKNIEDKLNKLLDLVVSETITESDYKAKKSDLERQLKILKSNYQPTDDWIKKAESIFNVSRLVKQRFQSGSDEEKRDLLLAVGSNLTIKDHKIAIKFKKPFQIIETAIDKIVDTNSFRLEPLEKTDKATFLSKIDPNNPIWLPGLDSNQ